MARYFFCGIGGNGMSPLARLLAERGESVIGSDRSHDTGINTPFFDQIRREGITIVPQDGSGVDSSIDTFIITRAVEDSSPDIRRARELGIPILKRPKLMAGLFQNTKNIAVGGTSGKSTTTGMIGHILTTAGIDPTVMNGAIMLNNGKNFVNGKSDTAVFEADESDGHDDVIAVCPAAIAVLTNISLDHFDLHELEDMFGNFIQHASIGAVLNADCQTSMLLAKKHHRVVTFGESKNADFSGGKINFSLPIPGSHNRANALAAIAASSLLGVSIADSVAALATFKGIKRRLEVVATVGGVRIVDDFASNPGKIEASVKTIQREHSRVFVIFQPHGFQPTKMMKQGYIDTFTSLLRSSDALYIPDIYYAGGTVNVVNGEVVSLPKDISSNDLVTPLTRSGRNASYVPARLDIIPLLKKEVRPGDAIIVMGSRDETLSDFARQIAEALKNS